MAIYEDIASRIGDVVFKKCAKELRYKMDSIRSVLGKKDAF